MNVFMHWFDMKRVGLIAGILAASWSMTAEEISHPDFTKSQVDFFENDVRPILEENCFRCHGGSDRRGAVKIKSEFQIISRKGLLLGGAHGPAVNVVKPAESLLLEMVSYKDDDHQMPPDGKLSPEQIAILNDWVAQGAPWSAGDIDKLVVLEKRSGSELPTTEINDRTLNYWSYKPLKSPEVPKVDDPEWAANPIDAFIYHQLKEEGLQPNPKASPGTLIRRASYNLTGLPPAPQEVEKFEEACNPNTAWTELVDELLAKPQYGETWGRHWLDLIRYAESNGFERDSEKNHIWRYRDYVIDSFNEDKPYDRFIKEQLAGDELEDATIASKIATGFHRLMQWDDEPADRPQHVYDVLDDNIRVTTEVFLGMTMGCARCHDHKGDPISQKDYYRFLGFFHNITQMNRQSVIENLTTAEEELELAQQRRIKSEVISRLEANMAEWERRMFESEAGQSFNAKNQILVPNSRQGEQRWAYTTQKPEDNWFEVGYRINDEADESVGNSGQWKRSLGGFGNGAPGNTRPRTEWTSQDIWLRTTFRLDEIPTNVRLSIYHDEDAQVYLNGQRIGSFEGYITDYRTLPLSDEALGYLQTGRNTLAVHCRQTAGGQYIDLGLQVGWNDKDRAEWIADQGVKSLSELDRAQYFKIKDELDRFKKLPVRGGIEAMMVQESSSQPKDTFVLIRGSAHAPGDQVEPKFPSIFGFPQPEIPKQPEGARTTGLRTVLADWIASEKNPRTARVMMNRMWQYHFGRGICPSPNDFGYLGEQPSHPELLDWLAVQFMESGWSVKAMQRLIMSSKTYQMSSAPHEGNLAKDPENLNFWRFNMRRLTAEEIRDSIMAMTGRLNLKMGGPSYFPVLPEAVLETSSTKGGKWGESPEDETWRRSVYITVKRSLQPPSLTDFDFADTDAPCPVRFVTTVPTQALNMLNSFFVNEKAEQVAKRLIEEVGTENLDLIVRRGLELALSREVEDSEVAPCVEMMQTFENEHGLSRRESIDRFCLVALNLNEFVYLD